MSKSFQLASCYRFVCPNAPLIARLDKFRFELSELFSITDIAGRILLRDTGNLCGGITNTRDMTRRAGLCTLACVHACMEAGVRLLTEIISPSSTAHGAH